MLQNVQNVQNVQAMFRLCSGYVQDFVICSPLIPEDTEDTEDKI
ncbi:MAG: hypothetical protein ACFFG0_41820 [Candidatus Thorarchaeota archaeon]